MRVLLWVVLFSISIVTGLGQSGVLMDSISAVADTSQKYCVYLPKDISEPLPLVFFLEPGGQANLPVSLYQGLADKYRLVFACPYGSKNGPYEPSIKAINIVLTDISARYSIDESTILLSGFSGGARLATLLAIRDKKFKGVIACGATFPEEVKITSTRSIPYSILVGSRDFNYLEGIESMKYLEGIQNPSLYIEFDGEHEWPALTAFEEAVAWQLVQHGIVKEFPTENYEARISAIKEQIKSGEWRRAYLMAQNTQSIYQKLREVQEAESLKSEIASSKEYLQAKKGFEKALSNEAIQRKLIEDRVIKMMRTIRPDTTFKQSEWQTLKNTFSKYTLSKDQEKRLSGERLLAYCSVLGYEQTQTWMGNGQPLWALNSAKMWIIFAPEEPYVWFSMARVQAALGNRNECLNALKKAFKYGFHDIKSIKDDSVFNGFRNLPEFEQLIATNGK